MKQIVENALLEAVETLKNQQVLPEDFNPTIRLQDNKDPSHGDFATNLAMMASKVAGLKPFDLAEKIISALPKLDQIQKTTIAGAGFINFFLNQASQAEVIKNILKGVKKFAYKDLGKGEKLQVEFVSANPTGPLHVGHGRGAAIGDTLCRILSAVGYDVTAEFYYNDAGNQIENLAKSVLLRAMGKTPESDDWSEDAYCGNYIAEISADYLAKKSVESKDRKITAKGDLNDTSAIKDFAVAFLRKEQDLDLTAFKVNFDVFTLESDLYKDKKVEAVVNRLIENGFTYEKDGALWLKTSEFGDDKDRVMRKSQGGYTYFVPDLAYHLDKWQRGFVRVVNEQGADHHSTVMRVRAGLQALKQGIPQGWPEYVLHQMVTVVKGGKEVKISKRAGDYLTLRDLIEEVGADATRYFLLERSPTTQLVFDIDLALERSASNPVYYLQYAHARICSLMREANKQGKNLNGALVQNSIANNLQLADNFLQDKPEILSLLQDASEVELLKHLALFPQELELAAQNLLPHILVNYLRDLAKLLHSWYNSCRVFIEDETLMQARLILSLAVGTVLAEGLNLLGINAPEEM